MKIEIEKEMMEKLGLNKKNITSFHILYEGNILNFSKDVNSENWTIVNTDTCRSGIFNAGLLINSVLDLIKFSEFVTSEKLESIDETEIKVKIKDE